MKVKIGDKTYDSNKTPIMLILDETDKNNLSKMEPSAVKYITFPDGMNPEVVKQWAFQSAIPTNISMNDLGLIAKRFFYWWYNQGGTNTEQGWSDWSKGEGKEFIDNIMLSYEKGRSQSGKS